MSPSNQFDSKYKRILITGDAGRGKTTFAQNLSKLTGIETRSTDDFYYIKKFTVRNDKEKSIEQINEYYKKDEWIVDGTTKHLLRGGLETADIIYYLGFKNILTQYYFIIKRSFGRKHERWIDTLDLLWNVTKKRYRLGDRKNKPNTQEFLLPYKNKVINLSDHDEIDVELEKYLP
jgi:adenylate kinase family enzyme